MVRICFVCLGNICRSPTAHGIMQALVRQAGLEHAIIVDSAGTGGWHIGAPADDRSLRAARKRGVELTTRAQKFVAADFDRFDYVIALDRRNRHDLNAMALSAQVRDKIHLLRAFDATAQPDAEVPDPYYGGSGGFDEVFEICDRACQGLLEHLLATHGLR